MDFFADQERAKKQSRRLLWLFAVMVVAVVVVTYVVLGTLIEAFYKAAPHSGRNRYPFPVNLLLILGELIMNPAGYLRWLWDAKFAAWFALVTLSSIAVGCAYKIRVLSRGGPVVAELLGGRCIESDTSDFHEKQLRNVVEEMAIASGMPMPEVYVLDRERGLNTFAAGHTRDNVAIGVTFGALQLLTREELQGAIAHEFSHILNGDTRLNMKLIGLAHGLMWPTIVGRILLRGTSDDPLPAESIFDQESSPMRAPFVPLAFPLLFVGAISSPFVRLIKSLICCEREWLADAAAVQFTRNPAGIEGALKKVGGLFKAGRLDSPHAEIASHLYFANCRHDSWFLFQSTHPPVAKRIAAIDPQFDGEFKHIRSLPSRDAEYDRIYENSLRRARGDAAAREKSE